MCGEVLTSAPASAIIHPYYDDEANDRIDTSITDKSYGDKEVPDHSELEINYESAWLVDANSTAMVTPL